VRLPCSTPGEPRVSEAECLPLSNALAGGLHADQARALVRDVRVEDAHGVAAAAHAGDHRVGLAADLARASASRHSWPITLWKSRTIIGSGCGPATVPMM
jgi:hypothetical protein